MRVRQTSDGVMVQASAKLNLFFEVLGKRPDGFHDIETLMCPVGLYDTVWFCSVPPFSIPSSEAVHFHCTKSHGFSHFQNAESEDIITSRENIVVRAVELLRKHAGIRAGARLGLVKRIPSSAGLGGGSSDAAAALAAANIGWGIHWPVHQLARIAAELGSDVPFFLVRGPAICRGRGEIVEPVDAPAALHFVVVRPPVGLATEAVYRVCKPSESALSVMPLVRVLKQGDKNEIGRLFFNRLFQAASTLSPWMDRLQGEFNRMDCLGHGMSGSGSSYFGLCRHARHSRRIARRLRSLNIGNVFTVGSCR